jgi:hypothetical protein
LCGGFDGAVCSNTKSFKEKISTARQFGLIATMSGNLISFLQPAKEFAFPTGEVDLQSIKNQCFMSPKLYGELFERYNGKSLPTQQALENIMMNSFGIAPNAKEVASRVFLETVNEIDALKGGVLTLERAESKTALTEAPETKEVVVEEKQSSVVPVISTETVSQISTGSDIDYITQIIPTESGKAAKLFIPLDATEDDLWFHLRLCNRRTGTRPCEKSGKMISLIEQHDITVLELNEAAERLAIYEETKNMTPAQRVERVNKIGEAAARKYGFKRVASARSGAVADGNPQSTKRRS